MSMPGFPSPLEQRWRPGQWHLPPVNRSAFSHLREIVPTARVGRSSSGSRSLAAGAVMNLAIPVDLFSGGTASLDTVLTNTYTDGFLLLHRGVRVSELYPGQMREQDTHVLMSVTKSMIGCVAGILVHRGLLDVDVNITAYIPEFTGTGYDGATVRQLLDMRSGIGFDEDYLNPDAEVRILEEVIDWSPRIHPDLPTSMYAYLTLLRATAHHGGPFNYRSCETDVLGWVCERVAGGWMPDLLTELLWEPIGAEQDADAAVDSAGSVMHDGGLATTLRDLGRFGQMLLEAGRVGSKQVVPPWWLTDTYAGGADSRAAFALSPSDTRMPGGMYRNQFWLPYPDRNILLCLGIYGQLVYIDPAQQLVAVKFSSWPHPQDAAMLFDTLAGIDAAAVHLAAAAGG